MPLLAGVMATPYRETKEGFESQMAINYLGHFLLTHLLMPQLVAGSKANDSGNARIVNVSSCVHRVCEMDYEDFHCRWAAPDLGQHGKVSHTNLFAENTTTPAMPTRKASWLKCFSRNTSRIFWDRKAWEFKRTRRIPESSTPISSSIPATLTFPGSKTSSTR